MLLKRIADDGYRISETFNKLIYITMATLTINEKINVRSFQTRFYRDVKHFGERAFTGLYENAALNKSRSGDYGGGQWEMPNAQWIEQSNKHLAPRYLDPSEL